MGCDIHIYLDHHTQIKGQYTCVNIDNWMVNPYYTKEGEGEDNRKYLINPVYRYRSYSLFGFLAGVRHTDIKPLDTPRGLPHSVSKETLKEYKDWEGDAHTPSWFTVKELIHAGVDANNKPPFPAFDEFLKAILDHLDKLNITDYQNVYVVFWFDN